MKFCPKCGSIMQKKDDTWYCTKCRYKIKDKDKSKNKDKFIVSEKIKKEKIGVLREDQTNVYPVISAVCPKCGNDKAYYFSTQTRAGDEAETRFFICTKCGYRWREYE